MDTVDTNPIGGNVYHVKNAQAPSHFEAIRPGIIQFHQMLILRVRGLRFMCSAYYSAGVREVRLVLPLPSKNIELIKMKQ